MQGFLLSCRLGFLSLSLLFFGTSSSSGPSLSILCCLQPCSCPSPSVPQFSLFATFLDPPYHWTGHVQCPACREAQDQTQGRAECIPRQQAPCFPRCSDTVVPGLMEEEEAGLILRGGSGRTGKHRMRTEVLREKIPLRVHVSPSFDLECLCGKCHVSSDILDEYLENSHAFGPITLSDSLGFILVGCCHGSGALFLTASQSRHGKSNQITYVWAPISSLRMFLCLLIWFSLDHHIHGCIY